MLGMGYLPATSARHVSYRPFAVESEVNWSPVWRQGQLRRNVVLVTLFVARSLRWGVANVKLLAHLQVLISGNVLHAPGRGTVRIAVVGSLSGIRRSVEITMEVDLLS
jgi:hypothetical protein